MSPKFLTEKIFPSFHTLRFKISILYVAVIGLVLISFQVILYFNYARSLTQEFDDQMSMKAEQIGGAVNIFRGMLGDEPQAFALAAREALKVNIKYPNYTFMLDTPEKFWLADAKKLGLDKDYLIVMDMQGNIITRSENVTDHLSAYFGRVGKLNPHKDSFYNAKIDGQVLRFIVLPYFYAYKQGYMIALATPSTAVENILWQHLLYVFGSSLVFLIIASLIVRLFVIRVLSSVMEISKVARNITQENLHARIKLTHADEEIRHLTRSINAMIARLEKSFSDVKEFSLEMAHEVKTPLAIISGQSQEALEKDHSKDEYKQMFFSIFKESKRTQRFVSDLLLLTKLDYRLIQLRFESLDLAEFIREICREMRLIAGSRGILIQEDILPECMMVQGDKIHLRRVFFNLIDNALKFTSAGGCIHLRVRQSEEKVFVCVSDTGGGIAQGEIAKIFNKFYNSYHLVRSSLVAKQQDLIDEGTGLGLNIVRSIVILHGGSISVDSEVGKGTSFTMVFPKTHVLVGS